MNEEFRDYVRELERRALTLSRHDPLRLAAVQSLAAMVWLIDGDPDPKTPDQWAVVIPFPTLNVLARAA